VVLLGESLSWTIVIGMAVILAGTVLTNLRRRANPEAVLERDAAVA
jgi:drug/metabolite transporter (DMT)-like permease